MISADKLIRTLRVLLLPMLLWISTPLSANTEPEFNTDTINTFLSTIEADMENPDTLLQRLDDYLEQLPSFRTWARECITDSNGPVTDINTHLKQLGEPIYDEPKDVSSTRQHLVTKKSELEATLASCNAILVRSDAAIKEISIFRKRNLERQSFAHGRDIVTVINEALTESHRWMSTLIGVLKSDEVGQALNGSEVLMLFSIFAITLLIGLIVRRTLHRWHGDALARWQQTNLGEKDTGMRVLAGMAMTTRRFVTPLLVSISIGVFMGIQTFDQVPTPLISIVLSGLPLLILAFTLTYLFYVALRELGLRDNLQAAVARSLRKSFNLLAVILFLGYLLFETILANSLSEATFFLARAILTVMLVLNVIWIIRLTKSLKKRGLRTPVRFIAVLLLIGALIAELAGYRNLAGFVLRGVLGTLVAYGLFRIASHLTRTFLDEFDEGKSSWQQSVRTKIGVLSNQPIPGFIWVRLVTSLSIWLLFVASLLLVWSVPEADIKTLSTTITQGFTIGSINIVPVKMFEAILVLIVLLTINGAFQRHVGRKWLAMTAIERGARESIATISNYVGVALAIIIALAVAGMDFSKLAIIAGALSVGIGFGLQNIVNNFVSGLILLFERPIKTGDWIVASGIEGRVKKISIRSTEIESFDHADIMVPNSALISGNLTNWVHKNRSGRIRMPVSVAYGSDTAQVRDLLIEIARSQKEVVVDHHDMHDPKVIFLAFGDSSLDLELRLFVRDILRRVDILSDINFEIDRVFREHNIEIPFPQRDIHIRDMSTETTTSNHQEP